MPSNPFPERSVTFRQLFLRTFALLAARWQPVLIGALSFALLGAVVSAYIERRVERVEERLAQSAGISWQQLEGRLSTRLSAMTETDMMRIAEQARLFRVGTVVVGTGALAGSQSSQDLLMAGYMVGIAPFVLLSLLIQAVILFVAATFFLLLALSGLQSAYEVSQRLPGMVFPMIGLWLWMILRSFLWVPFLGPFIALYFFPRLALAPVILASGERGALGSVQESMCRTKGRWLAVFLGLLGAAVTVALLLSMAFLIVSALALFSAKLSFFLWLMSIMFAVAWSMYFLAILTVALE